jgi:hypothetical protein
MTMSQEELPASWTAEHPSIRFPTTMHVRGDHDDLSRTPFDATAHAAVELSPGGPTPEERHHTPSEVADFWQVDVEMIRRIFRDEPGVMVLQSPQKKGKRPYKTIRIPQSVLERVHKRLQR